jgi:hypothetical protein
MPSSSNEHSLALPSFDLPSQVVCIASLLRLPVEHAPPEMWLWLNNVLTVIFLRACGQAAAQQ